MRINANDPRIPDLMLKFFAMTRLIQGEDVEEYQDQIFVCLELAKRNPVWQDILKRERAASKEMKARLKAQK